MFLLSLYLYEYKINFLYTCYVEITISIIILFTYKISLYLFYDNPQWARGDFLSAKNCHVFCIR